MPELPLAGVEGMQTVVSWPRSEGSESGCGLEKEDGISKIIADCFQLLKVSEVFCSGS